MLYLVDGHNLIPKLGLKLDSIDDEMDLVRRLQGFCRVKRAQVEVFFDGAPPGHVSMKKSGLVTIHFVRAGSSADAAIELRLTRMGRAARNCTVISSDNRVQRAAGTAHARALSSEEFASLMIKASTSPTRQTGAGTVLGPNEVEEWLEFFEKRGR